VAATDPRKVYNAMAKYFGLRARDSFLNPLVASNVEADKDDKKEDAEGKLLNELFGNGTTFRKLEEIVKLTKGFEDNKKVCVTRSKAAPDFGKLNNTVEKQGDQGWGKASGEYQIDELFNGTTMEKKVIAAFQVFPASTGMDISDTDIASLFMNSLYTLAISQAIPFLDVKLITSIGPEDSDGFTRAPPMSLGMFLGVNSDSNKALDPMKAKFNRDNTEAMAKEGVNLGIVGGMDLFTTPQTLVNNAGSRYDPAVGGRVDVFRPFLSVESLSINDTFSGNGTISYKSADMRIVLHDKGRLREVAEFVAPRRDDGIKFEITYGWSHPDGSLFSRPADADSTSRIGALIDAMRVTETYTVVNSQFDIQADGTVNIDCTLAMDGTAGITSHDVMSLSINGDTDIGGVTTTSLLKQLEGIANELSDAAVGTRISLPGFVQAPSISAMIAMDKKSLDEFNKFIASIKASKNKDVAAAGAKLYSIFNGSSSKRSKLVKSRDQAATDFCKSLRISPDPFLRPNKDGATASDFNGKRTKDAKSKNQKYVSFGKLLLFAMSPSLSKDDNEVHFIFSAINHNAAGVFDYNLAQFPIQIQDFENQLKLLLKTRVTISLESYIKFISDKFLTFDGTKAFGRSDIVQPNERTDDGKAIANKSNKNIIASTKAGDILRRDGIEKAQLDKIYGAGKRVSPTYTPPRVNVRIATRKERTPKNPKAAKTITRVYVQDQAAGRVMSTADALNSLMREGRMTQEDYSGPGGNVRSSAHNEVYTKNYQRLIDDKILTDIPKEVIDKIDKALGSNNVDPDAKKKIIDRLKTKEKMLAKSPDNLRKFFFESSPYLTYGTDGSAIIDASLSSESSAELTNMALVARATGKQSSKKPEKSNNLPFRVHPASLSLTTLGCPFLRLTQKYFVDFGTNTTLDNYYVVVGLSHNIGPGEFKTEVEMKPYDAYGSFASVKESVEKVMIRVAVAEGLKHTKKTKKK